MRIDPFYDSKHNYRLRRFFKISGYTLLTLVLILVLAVVLINTTPVQNYIAHRATTWLSKKLKTRVSVQHVRVDLLNHLSLNGLYIEDQSHDTLLYAGEATVRISDWFVLSKKPVLHYLALSNTYAHLYRTSASGSWNYDFIVRAFSTNDTTKKADTAAKIEFDLEKIALSKVRFHMDDAWGGEDLDFDIGSFNIDAKSLDFKNKLLTVNKINGDNVLIAIKEYTAGKPKIPLPAGYIKPVDTTPFNPGKWRIQAGAIALNECHLMLTANNNVPVPGLFDEDHLDIQHIKCSVSNTYIVGDTIHGTVEHLYAHERCGITIKEMRSKVSVSPVASICDQLYLETNNSKIRDYYAMHYRHFPSFLEYIDSVTMVGRLRNATIDTRDIAFFAPEMHNIPAVVQASGNGRGTVAHLQTDHLVVTDGRNVIKGAITMKGLPDIYKTYITFSNAEIFTNGPGILKYAPGLKDNPNLSVDQLTHAYFKGNYEGYIDNFTITGSLESNLGNVLADNVKLNIKGFNTNNATYSGSLATDKLQLGMILKQPLLGGITARQNIKGHSFNPDNIEVNLDGTIAELNINNYAYHNITTEGTLGKKKFNGHLLVDDPNLALDFDGGLDYNDIKQIKLNATAHLLYSNLKLLNLTRDTVTSAADFDLNCTGSNIDNFAGYARLYNIDLRRNAHKVAVDSVHVTSTYGADGYRELAIASNDITANIKGSFLLSGLPQSAQYYLSKYIPNYISAPVRYPPDQNLEFTIVTRNIDSLLAVTTDGVKGFDTARISGSFNTTAQKLTLNAWVPYGSIGRFHMTNISVNGDGNLDHIALSTNIDNVSVGDSAINSSLSLTATLANDSLDFTVATTVPDTSSAITINGNIIARKDSLFLSVLPSQIYLNRARWDIAGGSHVIYTKDFLQVQGIALSSGLQKITANTTLLADDQSLGINVENLDVGQLGYWAGLSQYQPDGRINGTVTIEKLFKNVYINANMKATEVKFSGDTIGTVTLIGTYDGAHKTISLDPQTGIYRGSSSIVASGNISFDSTTNQKLDGTITFNNAQALWSEPFLAGVFSKLSGTINGTLAFRGTSYDPVIDGTLDLKNGGFKVDYTGCNYSIPQARVKIDNHRIDFGRIDAYDMAGNSAIIGGYFAHNRFYDMRMHITVRSPKLEVLRLTATDNNLFYGNVIASMDSFTVRGSFNAVSLHAYNVAPADKSHLFIPVSTAGSINTYSFVTFKTYGKNQTAVKRTSRFKLNLAIDANLNDLAEMTIVLDPSAGDAITARGEGNIQLNMPANNDMRINGTYNINEGTYDFTFKTLEYRRQFILNSGSEITFNGPFSTTAMDVNATYSKRARLYDLLSDAETGVSSASIMSDAERSDAKAPQTVNVLLHMRGTLNNPQLTFDMDLPEKHSIGTYAYAKFTRINRDDRQKLEQVGSLLLIGSFIPSDGLATGNVAGSVAVTNIGQLVSSTASLGLTQLVNKLIGDKKLSVDVKYNNYTFTDQQNIGISRNSVKVGVSHPFFDDRLNVEVGSTSDWGRPASSASATNANSFNITGDFRIQYLLNRTNGLRLNAFRTSDYDVVQDKDITRGGVGISWRKSFDNFAEFFQSGKEAEKKRREQLMKQYAADTATKSEGIKGKE